MSKKHKFKLGDRVVYRITDGGPGNTDLEGRHGRIIYVDKLPQSRCPYTVEFDQGYADGVTDYRARENKIEPKQWHGWFCREGNLHKEGRRA